MELTLLGIFFEGVLSFLSPCVLPLLPLYMSYLAGEDKTVDEQGNVEYKTGKVFISTLFFVFGICSTLALLAVSANYIKDSIDKYSEMVSIICGTILIIFGLHEVGIIHINVLDSELNLKSRVKLEKMNFVKTYLLGFIFSLGWSPCIGPMLANALMLAITNASGYLYIIAYGLGLVIPFLICGLITSTALNFINNKKGIMKWVLKIAGIILICFGIYMIAGSCKSITEIKTKSNNPQEYYINHAYEDQYGEKIRLSDFEGKYVIVNFSTTWCTYCKAERPDYLSFARDNDDVICLYAMSPVSSGVDKDNLIKFINENIELRVIIDESDELASYIGVTGYPSKLLISPEGKMLDFESGAFSKEMFDQYMEFVRETFK